MASRVSNTPSTNTIIRGLEGTGKWSPTTLTYFFATAADSGVVAPVIAAEGKAGATFNPIDTEPHKQAMLSAFSAYEQVSALRFTAAASLGAADLRVVGVDNYTGLNGSMQFPSATGISYLLLNTNTPGLLQANETGGASAVDRVAKHELGHGLGLGHPHDTGNGTTSWTLSGVTGAGDDELDNERYTVMSYERGGLDVQNERGFGHSLTLSALDIAAIQHMYGANTTTHGDATTYILTDRATAAADLNGSDGSVSIGRGFYTIWDTGGVDEIRYGGSKSVLLNLNAATLSTTDTAEMTALIKSVKQSNHYTDLPNELKVDIENPEYHAGGFFSRIFDGTSPANLDLGGYAIANGVTVENAKGSGKNDFLIGNSSANQLSGGAGEDYIHGSGGNDTLKGEAGNDELEGGRGNDVIDGGEGQDIAILSGKCYEYDLIRNEGTGAITVTHLNGGVDGVDTLTSVEKVRFSDGEKDITGDLSDLCPPTDFIFLVDLSGSFSDDLPNFKAAARDMAITMLARDPDTRFALASFVDKPVSPYGSPGDYLYKAELALTSDVDAFENALGGLSIFNGNDYPEAQWVGLWNAAHGVGLNLREGSSRVIMLATDAPAHSAADYGLNESTITAFLESSGTSVVPADTAVDTVATTAEVSTVPGGDDVGVIPGPGDNGNGATPPLPTGGLELLEALVSGELLTTSSLPIFALTSGGLGYDRVAADAGGAVATLTSSGSNISDALREALAKVDGLTTETSGATDFDDLLIGTSGNDTIFAKLGNDRIEARSGDDYVDAGGGNDTVFGEDGNDELLGGSGQDTLIGYLGDDILNGGVGIAPDFSNPVGRHDFLFGGVGNDTYYVDDTFDLVDEGGLFPELAGAASDFDTIVSSADWFWDVYSVGERLVLSEAAAGKATGTTMVGSVFSNELLGNSGTNIMFGRGGSDTYRAGDGVDFISLNLLGVTEGNSYVGVDGPNTIIIDERMTGAFSYDVIFDFDVSKDKVDVGSYDYGSFAEIAARGHNDGHGGSYYALGDGLDYAYFVGVTVEQISSTNFIL